VVAHQEETTDIIGIEAQEAEEDFLDPDLEIEEEREADIEEILEMIEDTGNPQDTEKEATPEIEKGLMAADTDPETDQDQEIEDKLKSSVRGWRNHLHQKNSEITNQVHKKFRVR